MKVHFVMAPATFSLNYGDLGKGIDPPLGILYLASYLRKYGPPSIEIVVTDGPLEGFDATVQKVLESKADIVGISAVTTNIEGAYKIIDIIKKESPKTKIVLGGPHPTALPEEAFLRANPDVVIIGEGEETFQALVSHFMEGKWSSQELKKIDGICLKEGNNIIRTEPRKFIQDLDIIPFPARDLVDMKKYTGYPVSKTIPSTSIMCSRGCPFHCTFCSNNIWKTSFPRYRARSPKNVVEELKELKAKWGFKEFFDYSDEFNANLSQAKNLLKEIISAKLSIYLKCQLRVTPIDEELVQLMKKAGVWYVHLGIESGNEETLKGIRKMVTLKEVENCCRLLKKYDIKVWGLFMYFNIWEKDGKLVCEDYEKSLNTFNYAKKLYKNKLIDYFGGSITTPFPGSELWDIAMRHDLIKKECLGKYNMWFYKRDLRLVSYFPGVPESAIFKLHQKTFKYLVKSMLLGRVIKLGNLRFYLLRGLYFAKRQIAITFKGFLQTLKIK